ncbi:MAG: hypothetical protein J1E38_00580 [Paramuribaculum sp.]|nr:hypothetical protein [Paramuribaculum sp.]
MKNVLKLLFSAIALFVGLNCMATTITEKIEGKIGNYPATISYTMNIEKKTITGYFIINSANAPVRGKITLSGTFKHVPDPDVPHYPLYRARMTAKTSTGGVCGSWIVDIDTRMSIVEGKCSINGRSYKVSFDGTGY